MATKFYCDGCDKEIGTYFKRNWRRISVHDQDKSDVAIDVDLCDGCLRSLVGYCNPKSWPRMASEKVA